MPLHVAAEDLATTLDLLPRMGFVGCNVTIPHKAAVLAAAVEATERAGRIGAANTLTFTDRGIVADNTDGVGFIASLMAGSAWRPDRPSVVLGAGGAARGVIDALVGAGVPRIEVVNRSRAKAEAMQALGSAVKVSDGRPNLSDAGLVVNTTSLGMAGQPPLMFGLDGLAPDAVVTDIVYTPLETPLLAAARVRGNAVVDGLGMLLHQAVPGFEAWFGVNPEVDDDLRRAVLA